MVLSDALNLNAIRDDAKQIFENFDVNQNGFLSVTELQQLVGEIFPDAEWDSSMWPSMCVQLGADPNSAGLTLEQYLKMHTALVAGRKTAAWGLRSSSKIVRAEIVNHPQHEQEGTSSDLRERKRAACVLQ